jgi:hypothetical protein
MSKGILWIGNRLEKCFWHDSNQVNTFGKAEKARNPDSYGKNTLAP